jgi:hypothetical protein
VLDDADASAGPVGAEYFGKARDLRSRIVAEDSEYDLLVVQLIEPVHDRLRRFPHRSLRPQMLIDLIAHWRYMPCRNWRIDLDAKLDKARASLIEHRLVAGVTRRKDDPAWVGIEEDLAVIRVELLVDRNRAHLESHSVATFSLHAIARRLQRAQDGSIEALMHDIALAIDAASGDALTAGAGYRIRTHADGGGWRGRVIHQTGADKVERNVLSIRTWLPD